MASLSNKFDTIMNLGEVQRPYLFEMVITAPTDLTVEGVGAEELTVRCHKVAIPGRGAEVIEANFFGLKTHYAGRPTFGNNQLSVEFLEHEDQKVIKFLTAWNKLVYNENKGVGSLKYRTSLQINMFKNDGTALGQAIKFSNAFIDTIADAELVHGQATEGVKYAVTFRYDYWELVATAV